MLADEHYPYRDKLGSGARKLPDRRGLFSFIRLLSSNASAPNRALFCFPRERAMKRFFSSRQKVSLYLATNGHCARCGVVLGAGWHADHVIPHSKGGATYIHNGQALCKPCNLKKGATIMQGDAIVLRRFQGRFVETAMNRFEAGQKTMVADVHPGSGKTLAMLHTVNELYRQGMIDTAMVFVPRINLCQQFEMDWKSFSAEYAFPKMGAIEHRPNVAPLLRGGAFGYVTTYASLAACPELHESFIHGHRAALLLDEAQILGADEESGGTRAAEIVKRLGRYARYIIVASGTAYRSDGRRLLFASYTAPDSEGNIYLEPDIEASYQDGVSEGYLRPFEFQLADGEAIYEYFDGEQERLKASKMKAGLYRILEKESFWREMIDSAIDKVRELQGTVDPRICGLIGACSQRHADRIKSYIQKHHPTVKSLIAISDDAGAQDNLRTFKEGYHDILITVRMAYVGYDHKPISVIVALTDFRDEGFLRQFFARGMRVLPDVPLEQQVLWVYSPDDIKMAQFVERLRDESNAGLREREERIRERTEDPQQPRLGTTVDARLTNRRNVGMSPEGDLNHQELPIVEGLIKRFRLGAAPPTGVAELIRAAGGAIQSFMGTPQKAPSEPVDNRTAKEKEDDLRRELNDFAKGVDSRLMKAGYLTPGEWGHTLKECNKRFGRRSTKECGADDLRKSKAWIEATLIPFVEALEQGRS